MYFYFILVCVCFGLFHYLRFHWNSRRFYKLTANMQGPTAWPLVGCAYKAFLTYDNIVDVIYDNVEKYPGIGRAWGGPLKGYFTNDAEYMEVILKNTKSLHKVTVYTYFTPLFGSGLFTAPVGIWKRHRKLLAPTFNAKIVDDFVKIFSKQSTIMCEELKKDIIKKNFDFVHYITLYILKMFCETALGLQLENEEELLTNYIHSTERLMEIIFRRAINVFYLSDIIFNLSSVGKEYNKLLKQSKKLTEHILTEGISKFNRKALDNSNNEFIEDQPKPKIFLDQLLDLSQSGKVFTHQQLHDEINTFLFGGTDTTATAMSFLCISLGMHPDIQENIYKEVIDVLGPNRSPVVSDLPNLIYTERVIKESLRLFPVAPFLLRDITEEIERNDEVNLAAGTTAVLSVLNLHRNPKYWPEPLKFDPDRFLPEAVRNRHPYAYLPFSGGPRNCIGMNYALRAMKTMTALLVRQFHFSSGYKNVEDIKIKGGITMRPLYGYKIKVEVRKF